MERKVRKFIFSMIFVLLILFSPVDAADSENEQIPMLSICRKQLNATEEKNQETLLQLEESTVKCDNRSSQLQAENVRLKAKVMELEKKQTTLIELEQSGYVHHLTGFSYNIHSILLDWERAEKICESEGAHLASIHSNEENNFLFDLIKGTGSHWIGLKYDGQNWIWSDGSVTDHLNWKSNEPNGMANGHRWADLWWRDGKWEAHRGKSPFICKKRLSPGKTISIISSERKALIEIVQFGYTHHFNGSFYKIYSIILDWEKAEEICQSEGAHLASIHSNEENQFLHHLTMDSGWHYWIGMKYVGQIWIWSDGSVTDYLNWEPDEPNGMADGHRWAKLSNGQWVSRYGNLPFICKKRLST